MLARGFGASYGAMLREQDFLIGMTAEGKRPALAGIAARLGERTGLGQGAVLSALLHRERLGSTGIGHGAAIPHARLEGIVEPVAMLTTLRKPVWFGSPDDEPVDLLLTLLWPHEDVAGFLPALAGFSRLLRPPALRARLRASETAAEALAWIGSHGRHLAIPPAAATATTAGAGTFRPRYA